MAKRVNTKINTAEQTGAQTDKQGEATTLLKSAYGQAFGNTKPDGQPQKATFETYRKMRQNPTIALARMVATAPIRCAEWTIEADDNVGEDVTDFIKEQIEGIWHNLVNDALLALDYGYAPGEQIYDRSEGQVSIARIKPLLVDKTTILTDDHGNFSGLRNKANKTVVDLEPEECFLYSYDCEAGNLYGRARHENIRATAYTEWCDLQKKRARYFKKSAGAIPVVHYPDGDSVDAGGAVLPNFRQARQLIAHLQDGDGIAMPTILKPWAAELARDGKAGPDMEAWTVDFLETKAQHGGEFTDAMKHCESLMLRGWLVPERAASEAQTAGSRADSETSADFAMLAVDLTLHDIVQCLNVQVVDPLLAMNYGDQARGTVRIKRAGVAPAQQVFFKALITASLGNPANVALLLKLVDMNSLVAAAGLPEPIEIPTQEELEEVAKPEPPPMAGDEPPEPKQMSFGGPGSGPQPGNAPSKQDIKDAFHAWGSAGHELKPKLRSDETLSDDHAKWRDTIDHHLNNSTPHNAEVFRGLRMSPDEAAKLKVGGVVSDKSYQSVSTNVKTAKNYALPRVFEEDKSQPVVVHIAKGHSGVDVSKLVGDTASKNEKEVLIPRNTHLQINKVEKDKDGVMHVHASELKAQQLHASRMTDAVSEVYRSMRMDDYSWEGK